MDQPANKKYSIGICVICALLGFAGMFALADGAIGYFTDTQTIHWVQLLLIGYFSLIMLVTAFTGRAPSWAGDSSIFKSKSEAQNNDDKTPDV